MYQKLSVLNIFTGCHDEKVARRDYSVSSEATKNPLMGEVKKLICSSSESGVKGFNLSEIQLAESDAGQL